MTEKTYLSQQLSYAQYVAGQIVFFFWGGGATWPSESYGDSAEKPRKFFEFIIPEIAANASNFEN